MFRQIVSIISLLLLLASCGSNTANSTSEQPAKDSVIVQQLPLMDSVEIFDSIAAWPFTDSIIDSKYFADKIGNRARYTKELETNDYEPTVIDTIRVIEWDSSYVKTLSNVYTTSEYLQTTRIADPAISFKKNIRVGMPEETVFTKFKQPYDNAKTYKYFLVTFGDGAENYLIFFFENRKVKYISFQPYTG